MSERETVGAAAHRILSNADKQSPQAVIETQREMQKGYVDELVKCAKRHDFDEPFYVCVQTRRERLLCNVIRNQFYARRTRPRPEYDLALYWYDPKSEQLSFVWCIPDKDTVDYLIEHEKEIPLEEASLLSFCKAFKASCLV